MMLEKPTGSMLMMKVPMFTKKNMFLQLGPPFLWPKKSKEIIQCLPCLTEKSLKPLPRIFSNDQTVVFEDTA